MGHRVAFSALAAVVLVGLLGCGGAAKTGTTQTMTEPRPPEKSVTPREVEQTFRGVEHAFPALNFRMKDSKTNTSPSITRQYAFDFGPGNKLVYNQFSGNLFVYATVKAAAADQSFEASPRIVRRANLIADFAPGTPAVVRSIITAALAVAATGSGRINGHSLRA